LAVAFCFSAWTFCFCSDFLAVNLALTAAFFASFSTSGFLVAAAAAAEAWATEAACYWVTAAACY